MAHTSRTSTDAARQRQSRSTDVERTVRDMEPRLHTKVMRNHFTENPYAPLYGSTCRFAASRGVHTMPTLKPLSAAMWASQRQVVYRFGWINAIFNPTKVLLGDDPQCLKDDRREREWLDE